LFLKAFRSLLDTASLRNNSTSVLGMAPLKVESLEELLVQIIADYQQVSTPPSGSILGNPFTNSAGGTSLKLSYKALGYPPELWRLLLWQRRPKEAFDDQKGGVCLVRQSSVALQLFHNGGCRV
jgi:hypothetical protein